MKQLLPGLALLFACSLSSCAADKDITPKPMNLETFANATINVVKADGIDAYLPTIALSDINEIRVIEGIPDDVDHKEAIQNTINRSGYLSKEFMFGVLSSPGVITVGHFRPDHTTYFMEIIAVGDDYKVRALENCPWWKIGTK